MEILAKQEEKGRLSLLARGGTYYVVVLDRGQDILFLAKGDQLAQAFKEQKQRREQDTDVSCPTCDFMLAAEGVYSIQKSEEFIQKISRGEAEKTFKEFRLKNLWQEFKEKIQSGQSF
ncbi:MAG: hypothetical protein LWX01_10735 [Deltaproteobacteria bacterium]|nr:hypothetical protein [Deltaproteobacteria bacterium]MDL1962151.1 hypothetical protein [Deltaproteobacteria bacterium]